MDKNQMIADAIRENKKSNVEIALIYDKISNAEDETPYSYGPNDDWALKTLFKWGWIVGIVSDGKYKELDEAAPISDSSMFPPEE